MQKIKGSFIEACKSDNGDKVGSMLSFGADVNWRDGKGLSGLHLAADNGYSELLEVLLAEDKINVNLTNKNRNTALMFACSSGHEDIVRRLSQAPGVDLNCRDVHGLTALHWAVAGNKPACVSVLREVAGLDWNVRTDDDGWYPLTMAIEKGRADILQIILSVPEPLLDLSVTDSSGRNIAKIAEE